MTTMTMSTSTEAFDREHAVHTTYKSHLDTLGLEEGIYQLEAPLHAARLDIRVASQSLLQLIHLAHRQRRGRAVLLQSASLMIIIAAQAVLYTKVDQRDWYHGCRVD